MKALTISQPFASLIAAGSKWIENRTWPTNYRGPLAIHAGKGSQYLSRVELAAYPTGAVVAVGFLVACVHLHAVQETCDNGKSRNRPAHDAPTYEEILFHSHAEGPWLWVLRDVVELDIPIPYRGAQGLWECPIDLGMKVTT